MGRRALEFPLRSRDHDLADESCLLPWRRMDGAHPGTAPSTHSGMNTRGVPGPVKPAGQGPAAGPFPPPTPRSTGKAGSEATHPFRFLILFFFSKNGHFSTARKRLPKKKKSNILR